MAGLVLRVGGPCAGLRAEVDKPGLLSRKTAHPPTPQLYIAQLALLEPSDNLLPVGGRALKPLDLNGTMAQVDPGRVARPPTLLPTS